MAIEFAVVLVIVGILLVPAEVMVPSGGVVAVLSLASLGFGLWGAFSTSVTAGWILFGATAIGAPLMLFLALKVLPQTRLGRRMIHGGVSLTPEARVAAAGATRHREALTGRPGRAASVLRPSGVAEIDGARYDVVTGGEMLEPGTPIEVVAVEGNRIVVRAIETDA